jgi:hypothetical protein
LPQRIEIFAESHYFSLMEISYLVGEFCLTCDSLHALNMIIEKYKPKIRKYSGLFHNPAYAFEQQLKLAKMFCE